MFDWKNFEQLKNILSQVGVDAYWSTTDQHNIKLRPKDLIGWIEFCKNDLDYLTLLDIAAIDLGKAGLQKDYNFEIVYMLFNMGTHQRISLHVFFNEGEVIPSVSGFFSHAAWMEQEQAEMFGVSFNKSYGPLLLPELSSENQDKKRLPSLRINPNKSEDPYPEESWIWREYGLFSAVTKGNFELQVCYDPNVVVASQTTIGFHHRSIEKLLASRSWIHISKVLDPLIPSSSPTLSTAWLKTIEEMGKFKLPERAQAIRIILLELSRVTEHLTVMSEILSSLGLSESTLFINAREKVIELFEKYCGHRWGQGAVILGGVFDDLPHGWISEYQSVEKVLVKNLKIIHQSLLTQQKFRLTLDAAGIDARTVLDWGLSGPAMRASGLNFDLRKSRPLYFYRDIDFDVPVGIHGTAYDRYLIRYEEILQSFRIMTQVLDNLPLGDIKIADDLRDDLLLQFSKNKPNGIWYYSVLESANGEMGTLALISENFHPYRLKIKSPSFSILQSLNEFLKGLKEHQVEASIASLGIRKSDLDR
jgi:NADH-quinone oxidoreductase subunit C/D